MLNYKKLFLLTDRLCELIDDQAEIFLSEFGYIDWLSLEHLKEKYPDFEKAKKELDVFIPQVIDELLMLFPQQDTLYQQALQIFNSNKQTSIFA